MSCCGSLTRGCILVRRDDRRRALRRRDDAECGDDPACKATVSIPVFVKMRPRGGSFVYSDAERDVMRRDAVVARELGADGVAIGDLHPNGIVDLALVRLLVEAAWRSDFVVPRILVPNSMF